MKKFSIIVISIIIIALLLATGMYVLLSNRDEVAVEDEIQYPPPCESFIEGKVIVHYSPRLDASTVEQVLGKYNLTSKEETVYGGYKILLEAASAEDINTLQEHPELFSNCSPSGCRLVDRSKDSVINAFAVLDTLDQQNYEFNAVIQAEIDVPVGEEESWVKQLDQESIFDYVSVQRAICLY